MHINIYTHISTHTHTHIHILVTRFIALLKGMRETADEIVESCLNCESWFIRASGTVVIDNCQKSLDIAPFT